MLCEACLCKLYTGMHTRSVLCEACHKLSLSSGRTCGDSHARWHANGSHFPHESVRT
jgi:hypothetical protein